MHKPTKKLQGPRVRVQTTTLSRRHAWLFAVARRYQPVEALRRARALVLSAVRTALAFGFKVSVATLIGAVVSLPMFSAFEAHIIQVTASPVNIDPPILTIPGDVGWNNIVGGVGLTGQQTVGITALDVDANFVSYTYQTGTTSPAAVVEPNCYTPQVPGGFGPATSTLGVLHVDFSIDTVIKAVTCHTEGPQQFQSVTNTKVYSFENQCKAKPYIAWPTGVAAMAAGGNSSADDVLVYANVTVNGDTVSNHDISAFGGGANRQLNGNATAVGGIEASNFTVSGTVATGSPAASLPSIDINGWKVEAAAGGTASGSLEFANNTGGLELGPAEIMGNLTFGASNSANIRGHLYVHGNLTIGANTTITQDASMENQATLIIVDGTVDIDSNVSFEKAGTSGVFVIISNAPAQAGDDAAIETSSNNSDLGSLVLYASQGDIHVRSNRTLIAAFAAHGTSESDPALVLRSNVTLNYRELPTVVGCSTNFAHEEQVVINEFMPNPIGDDTGVPGGPLDGEWVELYNGMSVPVDVNGWALYNGNATGELVVTAANVVNTATSATSTVIAPYGYLVVYRDGNVNFTLDNDGDVIRLFSAPITSGGVLVDSHSYSIITPAGKTFTRMPDGTANWVDPEPTPGEPNVDGTDSFSPSVKPTPAKVFTEADDDMPEPVPTVAMPVGPEIPSDTTAEQGTTSTSTVGAVVDQPNYNVGGGSAPEVLGTSTDTGTPAPTSTDPIPVDTASTTPPVVDPTTTPVVDTGSGSGLEPLPPTTTPDTTPAPEQPTVTPPPATEPSTPPADAAPAAPSPDPGT